MYNENTPALVFSACKHDKIMLKKEEGNLAARQAVLQVTDRSEYLIKSLSISLIPRAEQLVLSEFSPRTEQTISSENQRSTAARYVTYQGVGA